MRFGCKCHPRGQGTPRLCNPKLQDVVCGDLISRLGRLENMGFSFPFVPGLSLVLTSCTSKSGMCLVELNLTYRVGCQWRGPDMGEMCIVQV